MPRRGDSPLDRRNPREGIIAVSVTRLENIPGSWLENGSKYVLDLAYEGFCTPLVQMGASPGGGTYVGALPVGSYYGGADIELRVRKRGDPRKKNVLSKASITMSNLVNFQRKQAELFLHEETLKQEADGAEINSSLTLLTSPAQSQCGFRNPFYTERTLVDRQNPDRRYTVVLEYIGGFAAEKMGQLGLNMLHRFAAEGQYGMLLFTLKTMNKDDLKRYVEQKTSDGRYPVEVAAQGQSMAHQCCCQLLLILLYSADLLPEAGESPIRASILSSNTELLDGQNRLVHAPTRQKLGLDPNNSQNVAERYSTLHYACEGGAFPTVRLFALDVDELFTATTEGLTPLAVAARYDNAVLLQSIFQGYNGVADRLRMDMHSDVHPLLIACQYGNMEVIDILGEICKHGIASDNQGRSPLHCASLVSSESKALSTFQLLLSKGFSAELKDGQSRSCLHELTARGYSSIINHLVDHNYISTFTVQSPDEWLNVPLYTAKLCYEILHAFNSLSVNETLESLEPNEPKALALCYRIVCSSLPPKQHISVNEPYSDVIKALALANKQEGLKPFEFEKAFEMITDKLEKMCSPDTSWMRDYTHMKKCVAEQLATKHSVLEFQQSRIPSKRDPHLVQLCQLLSQVVDFISLPLSETFPVERRASTASVESEDYEYIEAEEEVTPGMEGNKSHGTGAIVAHQESSQEASFTPLERQRSVEAVDEADLNENMEELVRDVAKIVNAPIGKVVWALKQNKWRVDETVNSFFEGSNRSLMPNTDEAFSDQALEGLQEEEEIECMTCLDDLPPSKVHHAGCRHYMCENCWKDYLKTCVQEYGSSVVFKSQCPTEGCNTKVPEDLWKRFAASEDLHEYEKWLIRQFVNASPDIVLCPSSHCRRPVKYTGKKNDITCPFCGQFFCARCEGDAHSPSTCQEVELWHEEKRLFTDEATERYVMRNFKRCPQCHTYIERTQGCNHMKCTNCNFEYCYMCKRPWADHGGGFFQCKYYEEEIKASKKSEAVVDWEDYTEEEKKRALEELNTQRQKEFELTNAGFQQQQDGIDRCRDLLKTFQLQNEALKDAEEKAQHELEKERNSGAAASATSTDQAPTIDDATLETDIDVPPLSSKDSITEWNIDSNPNRAQIDRDVKKIFDEWSESQMEQCMGAVQNSLEDVATVSNVICSNTTVTKAGERAGTVKFFTSLTPNSPYMEFQCRHMTQGRLMLDQRQGEVSNSSTLISFSSNGQVSCGEDSQQDDTWAWSGGSVDLGVGILFDDGAHPIPQAKCYLFTVNGREVVRLPAETVDHLENLDGTLYKALEKRVDDRPASQLSIAGAEEESIKAYRTALKSRIQSLAQRQPCCSYIKLVMETQNSSATVDLVAGLPSFINFDWNSNLTRLGRRLNSQNRRSLEQATHLLEQLLQMFHSQRASAPSNNEEDTKADADRREEVQQHAKAHYDEIMAGGLDALPVRRRQRERYFGIIEKSLRVLAEFHHVYKWTWVHTFYMTSDDAKKGPSAAGAAAGTGGTVAYSDFNRKKAVESSLEQLQEVAQILFDEVKPTGSIMATKTQYLQHLARLTQDRYHKLIQDFEIYNAEMGESDMVNRMKKRKS
eukprot:gb/GECG01014598.1/.p1 GENE.gb/GECG01014598.1/~~gb/GECG01014598.1/.p1  ORF type:complete len:1595 (+),score=237.98 gb/GECG01014598.1/:1-4785(+)